MKIRHGFVSNSSSTSFCIYGVYTEGDSAESDWDLIEKAEAAGLNAYSSPYDGVYIGLSFTQIKDDETGAEFKARAQQMVDELFGVPSPCEILEESWYNG